MPAKAGLSVSQSRPSREVSVEMWQDPDDRGYGPVEVRVEVRGVGDTNFVAATMTTSQARSMVAMLLHLADAEELYDD